MKDRRLFQCIGHIDDDLILEAERSHFQSRKGKLFLELSACLVLAGCLGLVIAVPRLLSKQPQIDTPLSDQIQMSAEIDENAYFSFGGLSLNMTQEQVLALLGEPEQISEEENPRWFYPSLTVQFHSFNLKVSRIWLLKGCELTLLNGIGIGSSEEQLKKAYPDLPVMQEYYKTPYLEGAYPGSVEGYAENTEDTQHQLHTDDLTMRIGVSEGKIEYISVIRHTDPVSELNEPVEEQNDPTFSFGGVSLDMTQDQVRELLGEPTEITEEESPRWFYPTHVVRFHAFDKTVSSIGILTGCELKMTNGIGLGSTENAVKNAYPDADINQNYNEHTADTSYHVYRNDQFLLIGTADGEVVFISLICHKDPMLEALTSEAIAVYTPVDAGHSWECMTLTGKAAKLICTAMTISDPEEPSAEKSGTIRWMDFQNGTAVELYGNDHAAIYTYSGEVFDPSRTDGLVWRLSGCFYDLDDYVWRAIDEATMGNNPDTTNDYSLQTAFPQLNTDSLTAYLDKNSDCWSNGWESLYINKAGLNDHGTDIYTNQGDQVLAIDAKNGITLVRVQGENYQGVLAIIRNPKKLSLQITSQLDDSGEYIGDIAAAHNGILAINAGPLAPNDDGSGDASSLYGYTMSNGTEYNANAHLESGFTRLEINSEGRFFLTDTQSPVSSDTNNAVEAPFALIKDGTIVADESITGLHPRTCIGQTQAGEVLMLVIEGRLENSLGAGLPECAKILQRYDCENALNLLQGTASILWFDGEYVTRCSNKMLPQGRLLPAAFVVKQNNTLK